MVYNRPCLSVFLSPFLSLSPSINTIYLYIYIAYVLNIYKTLTAKQFFSSKMIEEKLGGIILS